jgi:AraC-like DNA-binding protein
MPARSKFLTASPGTLVCFARAPGNFAGRPQEDRWSMDAFSEVLSGVRLKGAMFFRAEFSAPWRLSTPHCRVLAPVLAPGAPHIVVYHFVVEGAARARLDSGPDVELSPGDIVVFPHGDPHQLSAGPGTNPVESGALLQRIATGDLSPMQAGGGGAITRFVCGYLTLDPLLCGPILESLPPILKVNVRTDPAGHWLEQSILHLLEEAVSNRAGSDAMLAKLSEALFVDTVRRYVASLPDQTTGWLAGARDTVVGKSLALLHRQPEHPWTIAELATAVGVSRSALVARFTRFLSDPPMTYLTGWRLRLAAQALTSSSKGVADLAAAVGYESEAAFNRAFKRAFGVPPARYRRQTRKAASAPGATRLHA